MPRECEEGGCVWWSGHSPLLMHGEGQVRGAAGVPMPSWGCFPSRLAMQGAQSFLGVVQASARVGLLLVSPCQRLGFRGCRVGGSAHPADSQPPIPHPRQAHRAGLGCLWWDMWRTSSWLKLTVLRPPMSILYFSSNSHRGSDLKLAAFSSGLLWVLGPREELGAGVTGAFSSLGATAVMGLPFFSVLAGTAVATPAGLP